MRSPQKLLANTAFRTLTEKERYSLTGEYCVGVSSRGLLNCLHQFTACLLLIVVDLRQILIVSITKIAWMRHLLCVNKGQYLDLGLHCIICNCAYFTLKLFSLIYLNSFSLYFLFLSWKVEVSRVLELCGISIV